MVSTVSTRLLIFLKGQHLSNVPRASCPPVEARAEIRGQSARGLPQLSPHFPVLPLNNAERPENVRNHTSEKRNAAERCITLTRRANGHIGSCISGPMKGVFKHCNAPVWPLLGA